MRAGKCTNRTFDIATARVKTSNLTPTTLNGFDSITEIRLCVGVSENRIASGRRAFPGRAFRPSALQSRWVRDGFTRSSTTAIGKEGDAVLVITRGGYDFTERYPLIVAAAKALKGSFIIDGEGVVCDPDGVADFALMQSRQHDAACFRYEFDLVTLGSKNLRDRPLIERKSRLEKLLAQPKTGIVFSEHVETRGDQGFAATCKMGLEGIVSKGRDRPYVSGPCKHWIKVKNPDAPWKRRLVEN